MLYVIQHCPVGSTEWRTLHGEFPDRHAADRHLADLGGQERLDPTGAYRVVESGESLSTLYTLRTWTGTHWGLVRKVAGIGEAIKHADRWASRVRIPARVECDGVVVYEAQPAELV